MKSMAKKLNQTFIVVTHEREQFGDVDRVITIKDGRAFEGEETRKMDTINAITTAGEFGITQAGQVLAGMVLFSTDVRSIGLDAAQGLQFTKAWYYDLNDETRAWAERFRERTGSMPTMVHAGLYSSTLHYLQAIDAIGTDEAQAVRQQMADTPINDIFATGGYIREDGRMVHDMYLVEVKTPEESQNEDDLFRVVRTIPAEEAFRPLSESQCRLVANGA